MQTDDFGSVLHRFRLDAALTQEDLAERAGISVEAVSALERGVRRSPRRDTVRRLADALHLDDGARDGFLAAARAPRQEATGSEGRGVAARIVSPVPATSFIGRKRERREVATLLADVRLLTLTGPGGVGKTRLALVVASDCAARFPDGVYVVPLAGVANSRYLIAAIADALGMAANGSGPVADRLRGGLLGQRVLLVLDNFEHLTPGAPQVASLLDAHPGLTVLATSRVPLRLSREYRYAVLPMSLPDVDTDLTTDDLAQYDGTALFLHRWQAAGGRSADEQHTMRTIAAICAKLDGLPLAIELAAARAALLSVDTLLARLRSRLTVLGQGPVDAPVRQQTMRGVVQWSYALLPPEHQALFRRLAVFAAHFTLQSAEAVCGDVLDDIVALTEASLLLPPGATGDGSRFTMLGTIHDYALELLEESGEAREMRCRHAERMVSLAKQLAVRVASAEGTDALHELRAESDNLRAALEWCRADASAGALGLQLATSLLPYWLITGGAAEGRYWHDVLLETAQGVSPELSARAHHARGVLARESGDTAGAWRSLEVALALYREIGDNHEVAGVLHALSYRYLVDGEYARGIEKLNEVLSIRRAAGDRAGIAETLGALSSMYGLQNQDERAIALLSEAVALRRDLGDPWGLAVVLSTLGMTLATVGEIEAAEPLLREALDTQESLGNRVGTSISYFGLTLVARQRGDLSGAHDLCRAALGLWRESRNVFQLVILVQEMAVILLDEGDAERATQLLGFVQSLSDRTTQAPPPRYRRVYDAAVERSRASLGDAAFRLMHDAGGRLTTDGALELALA
jgi:predicted ATPase/DNA-binding XRE family transcriptional regulator